MSNDETVGRPDRYKIVLNGGEEELKREFLEAIEIIMGLRKWENKWLKNWGSDNRANWENYQKKADEFLKKFKIVPK